VEDSCARNHLPTSAMVLVFDGNDNQACDTEEP